MFDISVPCTAIAAAIAASAAAVSAWCSMDAEDPIDPNYTQIVTPVVRPLPPLQPGPHLPVQLAGATTNLMDGLSATIAFLQAIGITYNRASGAEAAGDTYWDGQQLQAVAGFKNKLAVVLSRLGPALEDFQLHGQLQAFHR